MKIELNKVIFIMGVLGVGKFIIGKILFEKLVILFFDGDDFYFFSNIFKMLKK